MDLFGAIVNVFLLAQETTTEAAGEASGHAAEEEEGGSFLVTPSLGLMIWTLLVFLFTMWVLSKVAFPRIQEALDKRAKVIADSIEAAEKSKEESEKLVAEYRARLKEAREQADDIIARYGADTARWFVLSDSPPDRDVEWTAAGAEAAHRHLGRV